QGGLLAFLKALFCAHAAVGAALREQVLDHLLVAWRALTLPKGAFVPIEPQPFQPSDDRGFALESRPLTVGVLDAQDECATVVTGKSPVK
ncbi:MAG: hypothetical protein ACI9QQ_003055, partial [Myxococcota bacterium]